MTGGIMWSISSMVDVTGRARCSGSIPDAPPSKDSDCNTKRGVHALPKILKNSEVFGNGISIASKSLQSSRKKRMYCRDGGKIRCGSHNDILLTNAYKYLYRAGNKDGNTKEQDISKAIFYFDYANKLINGYETLYFNGNLINESDLYLEIKVMLNEHI